MAIYPEHLDTGTKTQDSSREHVGKLGLSSDEAGHFLAKILGGSGTDKENLFPQNPKSNKQQYHTVEKKIKKAVLKYGCVQYYLKLMYDKEDDTRPHTICYSFHYGNVIQQGTILNPK